MSRSDRFGVGNKNPVALEGRIIMAWRHPNSGGRRSMEDMSRGLRIEKEKKGGGVLRMGKKKVHLCLGRRSEGVVEEEDSCVQDPLVRSFTFFHFTRVSKLNYGTSPSMRLSKL